jgi:ribonuclease D
VHAQQNTSQSTFIDSPAGVREFVESIKTSTSVALDTEGASVHRYVDRVYLIQISSLSGSAIIDPLAMDTPPGLGQLLADPGVQVVFHDADYDLRLLQRDYGWNVRNIFDTRVAAQLLGIKQFGLGALLESRFGVKLNKKFQRADWSMRPLSAEMLDYAALDTSHLLDLRDELAASLDKLGRASWAAEEFTRVEGTRWENENGDETFLRIKGARELSRPQLAVLRELVAWRDEVAREIDKAVFRVLGNEPMLAIAQSNASSMQEISAIKGVPRGLSAKRSADLVAAVERGRVTPADKLPRFPKAKRFDRDPRFDERVAQLRTVRDAAARRLDLDPGVLCSRERLESIARRAPANLDELAEVEGLRRWQIGELGADFLRALGS